MSVIKELHAEVQAAMNSFKPEVEGLRDLNALNLIQAAKDEVAIALERFGERLNRLSAVNSAVNALIQHGYPEPMTREVSVGVYNNLVEQETTISSVLRRYHVKSEAVAGEIIIS